MPFCFPYTCPIIDDQIKSCEDTFEHLVRHIINTYSPKVTEDVISDEVEDLWESYKSDFIDLFEEVRTSNSDMRDAADEKVQELEEEVSELSEKVDEMQETIDELLEALAEAQ